MERNDITLICGDCLEVMPTIEAGSVDAVITDLPYYKVVKAAWDNQWKTRDDYLDWVVSLAHEWKRVTKDNSSIFLFCDEKMEAYIQVRLDEIFLLLNKIVWYKTNNLPQKNAHLLRTFAPMTERALFYTTETDYTGQLVFAPVMNWFSEAWSKSGLTRKQVDRVCNTSNVTQYWFLKRNYQIPTLEKYAILQQLSPNAFSKNYEELRREYEELCHEYEELRRPFNADAKTFDVIEWPIISQKENTKHETTKPLGLMNKIVSVVTNPGQVILDCCMGSGTTGVACVQTGRKFIGIELDPKYFKIAEKRIKDTASQLNIFSLIPKTEENPKEETEQMKFDFD